MNDQDWQIRMRPEDFLNKKSNGFETMETMRAVGLRVLQKSFDYQEWLVHPEEYAQRVMRFE